MGISSRAKGSPWCARGTPSSAKRPRRFPFGKADPSQSLTGDTGAGYVSQRSFAAPTEQEARAPMASYPEDLKYTKEHEWARVAGGKVTVGITAFAQEQLGDVVYLELPKVGDAIRKGEPFGVVESTKAVSELFAPVSGKV